MHFIHSMHKPADDWLFPWRLLIYYHLCSFNSLSPDPPFVGQNPQKLLLVRRPEKGICRRLRGQSLMQGDQGE